jgi:hypothetical protein
VKETRGETTEENQEKLRGFGKKEKGGKEDEETCLK